MTWSSSQKISQVELSMY